MHQARGWLPLFMAVLFVSWLPATPVNAHDHRPPKAKLRVEGEDTIQRGYRYQSSWVSGGEVFDGRVGCVGEADDGPIKFRSPLEVNPGPHSVAVIFRKRHRPDFLEINAWRQVDERGRPIGEPESVPYNLTPRPREGRIRRVWRADFSVMLLTGDSYLQTFARWRDRQGCGDAQQDAAWTFHLAVPFLNPLGIGI